MRTCMVGQTSKLPPNTSSTPATQRRRKGTRSSQRRELVAKIAAETFEPSLSFPSPMPAGDFAPSGGGATGSRKKTALAPEKDRYLQACAHIARQLIKDHQENDEPKITNLNS